MCVLTTMVLKKNSSSIQKLMLFHAVKVSHVLYLCGMGQPLYECHPVTSTEKENIYRFTCLNGLFLKYLHHCMLFQVFGRLKEIIK